MQIETRRIYDDSERRGGYRVLVDRIWPRGVSKEDANIDRWAKEVAPSTDLRKWFGHEVEKWKEFRSRYRKELGAHRDELEELIRDADHERIILLYGAKDTEHNHAIVLREVMEEL